MGRTERVSTLVARIQMTVAVNLVALVTGAYVVCTPFLATFRTHPRVGWAQRTVTLRTAGDMVAAADLFTLSTRRGVLATEPLVALSTVLTV